MTRLRLVSVVVLFVFACGEEIVPDDGTHLDGSPSDTVDAPSEANPLIDCGSVCLPPPADAGPTGDANVSDGAGMADVLDASDGGTAVDASDGGTAVDASDDGEAAAPGDAAQTTDVTSLSDASDAAAASEEPAPEASADGGKPSDASVASD